MIMGKATKAKKTRRKNNGKNNGELLGISMIGLSGFRICAMYDEKSVPSLFKRKTSRKPALSY